MSALLFIGAVMAASVVLALGLGRAAATGDCAPRPPHRDADVVDLATARRLRNTQALGRRP